MAMMDWSRRDTAETWAFVLGLVTTAYLAFMPYLIERKRLSLGQCCFLAALLSLVTLAFFLVARINGARDENQRKKEERSRDQLLGQILRNQLAEMRRRGETGGPNVVAKEVAAELYTLISKEPIVPGRVLADDKLNRLIGTAERLNADHLQSEEVKKGIELAKPKASKPSAPGVMAFVVPTTEVESLRNLADLLARSSATVEQ